ncbi:OmpA family protein [Sphingomonas sp. LR60]|uniref:OmpA family protein n=1 Tax=Sphingomonas sp. LR60 TaxID=3050233 RepID=UPI002FE2BDCB
MVSQWNSRARRIGAATLLCLGMAACQPASMPANDTAEPPANARTVEDGSPPGNDQVEGNMEEATKSIIRPDIEPSPTPTPPAKPAEMTVGFPAKGYDVDPAGMARLDELIADPVLRLGGPITIWGHSDSSGSDAANLLSSRRRAEAARDYLLKKGVPADRISVIALGEARPVAPNRNLDGSDDPEGRAKNRRIEIKVGLPDAVASTD